MTSLTGLASASITSMIPGLCAAGQMKLVTMVQRSGTPANNSGSMPSLPNITIPALTGSQIAILYVETHTSSINPTNYPYLGYVIGSGSGVALDVTFACNGLANTTKDPFINSGFCTTTTSGVVSFSVNISQTGTVGGRLDTYAAVFIYTPPF